MDTEAKSNTCLICTAYVCFKSDEMMTVFVAVISIAQMSVSSAHSQTPVIEEWSSSVKSKADPALTSKHIEKMVEVC